MIELRVWGDTACFTRPEAKVERVSYEVMTPAAARGVLEAIYWKPEFLWEVHEIHVLQPIKSKTITTNEINHRQNESLGRRGQTYRVSSSGGYAGNPQNRTQRHNVLLRDVEYVIRAKVIPAPHRKGQRGEIAKHRNIFDKRVRQGRCFRQPYLGIREYVAFFDLPTGEERSEDLNLDLGRMHYDTHFVADPAGPLTFKNCSGQIVSGRAVPLFFQAALDSGVLRIPPRENLVREAMRDILQGEPPQRNHGGI